MRNDRTVNLLYFDTSKAQRALEKQSNRIMRDFRTVQAIKSRNAKFDILAKLKSILLCEISFGLQGEGEISETSVKDGWSLQILDGETNFLCGLPNFCSSATLFKNDEPILSVTRLQALNETVICENGITLVSEVDVGSRMISNPFKIDNLLCATDGDSRLPKYFGIPVKILDANILSFILVALGRMDAFIMKMPLWMQSIAKLYITQAGGMTSNIGPFTIGSGPIIHENLRKKVMESL